MRWAETYIPKKPCVRGHMLRYVRRGGCVECITEHVFLRYQPRKRRWPTDKIYLSDRPCPRGHLLRYKHSNGCAECPHEKYYGVLKPLLPMPETRRTAATFIPEKPCRRGHLLRYRTMGHCVECKAINSRNGRLRAAGIDPKKLEKIFRNFLPAEFFGTDPPERRQTQGTFVPAQPCKWGHKIRYVVSRKCVACKILEKQRAKLAKVAGRPDAPS